ncbi:MAG: hypothetical protein CM15mP58_04050 [Burkholderiaceae bacterium]|nr:MAG: hypothetical protein CM15mP58_04050 [Burkholderiaceae bacterium]
MLHSILMITSITYLRMVLHFCKRSEKNHLLELKIDRGQGKSLEWASDITKNNRQGFIHYNFQIYRARKH